MNYIEEYYANYDEDKRLTSRHGQVEYRTTMKYIHDFLGGENRRILEVGAGTGRYSIALARKGHTVDALEYVAHNLAVMNEKCVGLPNITTHHGTALDLSRFASETFDLTLVLGPMYHMYTVADKQKVLAEALRVTKTGGHLLVAYAMNEATVIQAVFKKGTARELFAQHMLTEDFRCISEEKELFEMIRTEEIDALNAHFANLRRVKLVATDGATNYMRECIDAMDDETFELWMHYHLATCERADLIGAANHTLDILEKI